jgi:hypothetical protein
LNNDGTKSGGFTGTGGAGSNNAGNCSGASCQGNGGGSDDNNQEIDTPDEELKTDDPITDILNYYLNAVDTINDNKCMGYPGSTIVFWNTPECLDVLSNLSQDLALGFSSAGAITTLGTTLVGCALGEGFGCGPGYALGVEVHVAFYNSLESAFSFLSFVAALRSDILTDDTYFNNFHDWGIGEDTRTGIVTLGVGGVITEPFVDAGVDLYASGYNHGYFCGISTVVDCLRNLP